MKNTKIRPTFSVVIPTYNHGRFIGRCLESVIAQSYENWEALVINNFSTDDTEELVLSFCRRDPRIKLFNFSNDGIIAASRNFAIKESTGEYIAFLDSDDRWHRGKLEAALPFLSDFDFMYHDLQLVSENDKKLRKTWGRDLKHPIHEDLLTGGNPIVTSSVVVRKEVLMAVGGLSEDRSLVAMEDFDCWIRIAQNRTNRFKYIRESLADYWSGPGRMTEQSLRHIQRLDYVFRKNMPVLNERKRKESEKTLTYYKGRVFQSMALYPQALKCFVESWPSRRPFILAKSTGFCALTVLQFLLQLTIKVRDVRP